MKGLRVMGLLSAMICLMSADVRAEEKTVQMQEVVVTASKIPKTPGNVTQQIDIISEEKLGEQIIGKGNITEVLMYQPGSAVSVLSKNDANWGSYGGIGPKYNTYLLNGLPIDSFTDTQSLDIWAFERIEIQRGPASVMYPNYLSMDFAGNQSPLAGTSNLILREKIDSPMTRLAAVYGSYNTCNARFYHQNHSGKFHYFMGGMHEQSDYKNYGSDNSWLNMVDRPEYEKTKLYIGTTAFLDDARTHKLSLFAHRNWHSGDAGRPNRDFNHEYTTVNAGYTLPVAEKGMAQIKLGFRDYDRRWEEDNYPENLSLASENGVKQKILPADITFSFEHLNGSLLTFGADAQFASYETYSEVSSKTVGNDSDSSQYGIFVQEELSFGDFLFRLGGRYNYVKHDIDLLSGAAPGQDSESWSKFLWNAGLRYTPFSTLSLYSNIGASFMAPGLKSVGGTLKLSDKGIAGKDGQLPNPDLKAETGLGTDIGVNYEMMPGLNFGIRGFFNKIDDAIVENRVSESPSQSQSVNAGNTSAYGAEIEARQMFASKGMEIFANYTYTETEIENDLDKDQDGAEVPFVPQHQGNIGLILNLPQDVMISAYLHLAGEIYDSSSKSGRKKFDAYETLNLKAKKMLCRDKNYQLDLFADLYNLTDNEFEMPWQFQDPGFSATVGIEAKF